MGGSYQITILIDIYLANFVPIGWLQNNSLTVFNSTHQNLRQWHVGKFKFPLIPTLFQTNLKYVYGAAKRTKANFRTILAPSCCCDGVVIFNLFASYFIPLWALAVEVVDIKAVKVANNTSLTSSIEACACKFFNFLIFWVVKALETISSRFIKRDLSIITASNNVGSPCKSVRNSWVVDFWLYFGVKIKGDKWVIEEARYNVYTIRWVRNAHNKGFLTKKWLTFVCFCHTNSDFSFGCTDDQIIRALSWPGHTGDWRTLWEFIANWFFLSPLRSKFINKDDVVWLSDCKLLRIGGESHCSDNIASVALFGGPDRELVPLLSLLVKQMNDSVWSGDSVFLAVGWPCDGRNLLHCVNGWL